MIITKLEMIRFGKFKDHIINFDGGLTARQQNNETGKTTTADFIGFIFYGLSYRGRKMVPLGEDLLEKYQPWDSEEGIMGAAEFTDDDGKNWRVERTQNRKGKGEVRLFDAQGNRVEIADVGQTFLGVDAETFSNVFYVRESGQAFRRTEQMDIAMKNLVTTGSESVGFDSVMDFLNEEKSKFVSPKGNSGKLKRLETAIAELKGEIAMQEVRLAQEQQALDGTVGAEEAVAQCDAKLSKLSKEAEQIGAYEAFVKGKKWAQLSERAEELGKRLETAGKPLSSEQISALRAGFTETEGAKYLLEQAENEVTLLQSRAPAFSEKEQQILSAESAANNNVGAMVLMVLAGIVAVAAAVLAVVWHPLCWIGCALGVAALIVAAILGLKLPKTVTALGIHSRTQLRQEIDRAKTAQEQLWQHQKEQSLAMKTVEERKEQLKSIDEKYAPLRQQTGIFDRQTLDQAIQSTSQVDLLRQQLSDIYAQMDELGEVEQVEEVAPPTRSMQEVEQLQQKYRLQKEQLLASRVAGAKRRAEFEQKQVLLAEQKEDLAQKEHLAANMRIGLEIVTIALEQMQKAQAALRENYAPRLREAMSGKLSLLTDGKYDTVMLDEDLSVRIKAEGGMRELEYFSTGTKDAAMLALRLSLAEILEREKKLPLIFDDPFLHLDNDRFSILLKYLQKAGKERQILLLSCREITKS